MGILEFTGTPVDRGVYVTLEGLEAMHMDWQNGGSLFSGASSVQSHAHLSREMIKVKSITSFIARAKSRVQVLHLQRAIDQDPV